ncbi:MAG: hypothetical protein M1820_002878 [Bogoriella megaspora]|nr:MAG: hypothetical protein M1820_002878 [Bogoriella megaspora]
MTTPHQILTTVTTLAHALDALDLPLFTTLFTHHSPITYDISQHLPQYPSQDLSVSDLASKLRLGLGGFTATQHYLSNPLVTVREGEGGKEASVKAYVTVFHFLADEEGKSGEWEGEDDVDGEGKSLTMRGSWDVDLLEEEGRWVVRKVVVRRAVPLEGERDLYKRAEERVSRGLVREGTRVYA